MKLEVDLSPTIEEQLTKVAMKVWADTLGKELARKTYPEWMSLEETCNYLNVSRTTLSKFIEEENFPVSVINAVKRCNRKQADDFMNRYKY